MATKKTTTNVPATTAEDKALARFADMMLAKIESIQNDWKKPWFSDSVDFGIMPQNIDGRLYNGMNAFMLLMLCEDKQYKTPIFVTFDRLAALNYKDKKRAKADDDKALPFVNILKGESAFPVFLYMFTVKCIETGQKISYTEYKEMDADERKGYNVFPSLRVYHVFNIDQTNLKEARPELYDSFVSKADKKGEAPATVTDEAGRFTFPKVDDMISTNGWVCPIHPTRGDSAYYSVTKDEVVIPLPEQFVNGEAFYSNLFHEMAHSTGANKPGRFNRFEGKDNKFGSHDYGREELVAEMTAALVCHTYGFDNGIKDESAAYLKSWCKSIRESPQFIKTVLMDVRKASSLITERIDTIV